MWVQAEMVAGIVQAGIVAGEVVGIEAGMVLARIAAGVFAGIVTRPQYGLGLGTGSG